MNRRRLLLWLGLAALTRPRAAAAAELPLLSPQDPHALQLQYVEDASTGTEPTRTCARCGLYQGAADSTQGPCALFPHFAVKAAGSCKSWAPQM